MHLVEELNGSTVKARYLRGSGLICQLIDSNTFYYLFNPHGDVVQRADQSGNLSTLYDYDAFGNNTRRYNVGYQPTDGLDTDPNPFRYCGEYFDAELGEIYLRNRSYAPGTGRFSSEDPIRSGGNWYGYCDGNPTRYSDPSGLKKWDYSTGAGIKDDVFYGGMTVEDAVVQVINNHGPEIKNDVINGGVTVQDAVAQATGGASNLLNQNITNAQNNGAVPVPVSATASPYFSNMIFAEDNRIEVPHGRYGYVRGGGTIKHTGLDISTLGNKTVHSTVSGTVWRVITTEPGEGGTSDLSWQYGAYIVIKDGDNYHLFAHCEDNGFYGLQEGDHVAAGQPIATMGHTGNAWPPSATGQGEHVHYEVRSGSFSYGADVDPSQWAGMPGNPSTPNIGGVVGSWYMI